MSKPDIEAIKARLTEYRKEPYPLSNYEADFAQDIKALLDYTSELEQQISKAILLPCKIGDEIEVRWSPYGNRIKVELFEIQEDNIARPAIYTDEGTFDFAPGEYQVIGTQEGKTCID
jgi:hypothetical protein